MISLLRSHKTSLRHKILDIALDNNFITPAQAVEADREIRAEKKEISVTEFLYEGGYITGEQGTLLRLELRRIDPHLAVKEQNYRALKQIDQTGSFPVGLISARK